MSMPIKINLSQETPDPDLYDTQAEKFAHAFDDEAKKAGQSEQNKTTQLRRFYDELVRWQECVNGDDEKFRQYEAFIRMLNAKVANAKGRKLVGEEFAKWFRDCIRETTNARALNHFRLHFEAVLGFLKALRR